MYISSTCSFVWKVIRGCTAPGRLCYNYAHQVGVLLIKLNGSLFFSCKKCLEWLLKKRILLYLAYLCLATRNTMKKCFYHENRLWYLMMLSNFWQFCV